ncbi:hypothetical protein C8Q79DRAFT_256100 [Trametes meyenii]|nr:hypothetical protein C8Q79DRAFT_256100 [Trametes meyenii]
MVLLALATLSWRLGSTSLAFVRPIYRHSQHAPLDATPFLFSHVLACSAPGDARVHAVRDMQVSRVPFRWFIIFDPHGLLPA